VTCMTPTDDGPGPSAAAPAEADELAVEGLAVRRDDGVLWLVLDRPAQRNALSIAVRRGLVRAMRAADDDPGIRVVVVTGRDPAFSSGVDLAESIGPDGRSPRGARTDPAAVLRAARTPVIAAVNGACYTGALELALSCSFVIASERATFADTHAQVGLLPGWGQTALLPRAVGVRMARQMLLTGEPVDAATALRAGLVTEVVPHDRLLHRAGELAATVAVASPGAAAATLDLLAAGEGLGLAHALGLEAEAALRWRTDPAEVRRRFQTRTGQGEKSTQ
jgi:enoyl-CoA hydratase